MFDTRGGSDEKTEMNRANVLVNLINFFIENNYNELCVPSE